MRRRTAWCILGLLTAQLASAGTILDSELADAYHFVDRYEVLIEAPPERVWPHLLDLGSWMYEFDMIHVSGPRNAEGAVYRLYGGQDFFFEITKIIPNRLIVGVNRPATMEGEEQLGVAMLSLTDVGGKTLVSNFMSRQHYWPHDGANPLRATRESDAFVESTRARWNRFTERLRELVGPSE